MADRVRRGTPAAPPEVIGTGFLLAQLGAHSAASFAERIASVGLTPPHVGILRAVGHQPGRSQQTIADEFGVPPSRMVGFIDELEARGLVERHRDDRDRRVHLLHLSESGRKMLAKLAAVATAAQDDLLRSLTVDERDSLADLLQRVADDQGLTRGIHPGYGRLRHIDGHAAGPSDGS